MNVRNKYEWRLDPGRPLDGWIWERVPARECPHMESRDGFVFFRRLWLCQRQRRIGCLALEDMT